MMTGDSGSPVSASQASTDSPWWSRPQATTSPGRVARAARRPRRRPRRGSPRVLLDPARAAGGATALRRRASRSGRSSSSKSDRLDRGRALVDAEEERAHARRHELAPRAATTAARRGAGRGPSGRSAPSATPSSADEPAHVLGDPERGGQAGRADRRDVDQARTGRRAADHIVDAAPGRAQPGVARDRLGARERRAASPPPSRAPRRSASRPHRPVVLVLLVDARSGRRRPGRRAWGTPVRPSCAASGTGSRIRSSGARRRVEDEELALARVDPEAVVAGQARDLVGAQAGAVDGGARARLAARRRDARPPAVARTRVDRGRRCAPRRRAPRRAPRARACRRRGRSRPRPGPRATPSARRADVDAVARGVRASARDRRALAVVARAQQRAAAQHRHAERVEHGSRSAAERRISRVSSSPGSESKPVWRIPEFVPLAPRASAPLGLQQDVPRRGGRARARRRSPRRRPRSPRRRAPVSAVRGGTRGPPRPARRSRATRGLPPGATARRARTGAPGPRAPRAARPRSTSR